MDSHFFIFLILVLIFFAGRRYELWRADRKAAQKFPPDIFEQTRAQPDPGSMTAATNESEDKPGVALRLFSGLFIAGWLVAWTAGIVMAMGRFATMLEEFTFGTIFVGGWLIAAFAGWFGAAYALYCMIVGKTMPKGFGKR